MSIFKLFKKNCQQETEVKPVVPKEFIDEVCEKTNWSRKVAENNLIKAKELGMPYRRYVKNEAWKLSKNELLELNNSIEKRKEKKDKYVNLVMEATNWDEKTTKKKMKEALRLGLSYGSYYRRCAYTLEKNEIEDLVQVLKMYKKRRADNDKFCVEIVSQKTGWSEETSRMKMDEAKKLGVSYVKYASKAGWEKDENELKRLARIIENDKKRINDNKEKYVDEICKATGWSKGKCELEVWRAKANQGVSYEDYCLYKFYEISESEQKKYVTLDDFTKMRIKYNDHNIGRNNFDDKVAFNENFSSFIRRKWLKNFDITLDQFKEFTEGLKRIIFKPLTATQGIGIKTFYCENVDIEKLYKEVTSLPQGIMEEFIVQHHEIAEFCESSVNTVRVLTLNDNGQCRLLYSVFRMGQGAEVDNFHAGGIAASVNVENGLVYTEAANLEAQTFDKHPVSKKQIKGFQIPHWDKVVELCEQITGHIEGVNLVGWDFAITEDGVDLIEGNPGASYIVAQIPNVKDRIGIRDVMVTPYL